LFSAGFNFLPSFFHFPFSASGAYPNNTKMWLEARSIPKTKAAQKLTLEKTSAGGNSQLIQKPQKVKLQDLCSLFFLAFR